ncbi:MAG: hypothetical protein QOD75_3508 [Blastocatellia bacterium]|jgi:hypothetical protein|nr:hypothetical protein [Blastocatellia bacterium]
MLMRTTENEQSSAAQPGKNLISSSDLARLQSEQHKHDLRNHFDIISLHKTDRLKHYGLHFAKYVGRLARESAETKSVERTLVDTLLVSLSAANTLHQDLGKENIVVSGLSDQIDPWRSFADASGRFADACEKIDHMEEFVPMARKANVDIISWLVKTADQRDFDLVSAVHVRRGELSARQFYIQD